MDQIFSKQESGQTMILQQLNYKWYEVQVPFYQSSMQIENDSLHRADRLNPVFLLQGIQQYTSQRKILRSIHL